MKKILLVGLVLSGLGVYLLWPQPEPEPENKQSDTGLTREETEALMRKIGYVQ
jgi:hypothetical protein